MRCMATVHCDKYGSFDSTLDPFEMRRCFVFKIWMDGRIDG